MSFPRYPTYKPSGVEWLGEVPEHWSIIRLKNVLQCRITDGPHTTPEFIDEGVPFLSVDGIQDGELKFDGCRFISEKDHEEFSRKAQPVRDDILMGKAASTGKIARVKTDFTFSIWSPLALIRVDSQLSSPSFYEQALKSAISQAQIDVLCTSNTQKNISMDDIPRLVMTRPTIEEQLAIATFLDHETAKIDALIAEQQRLIELLQEKRQAVISHAVTKGLNPHAPMKDSGVEWLGEVPEHWEILELKHLKKVGSSITYGIVQAGPHIDEGIPYIRTSDMAGDRLWLETCQRTTAEIDQSYARSKVEAGDLVIAIRATVGKTLEVPTELHGANLTQGTAKFSPGAKVNAQFVKASFDADYCQSQIMSSAKGATFLEITLDTLRHLKLAIPPPKEQGEIVQYLAGATSGIGELLLAAEQTNGLLQERRSALISAAVTGQIDVRGLVPEAEAA
jgi:type I restriction enzyme S subunit